MGQERIQKERPRAGVQEEVPRVRREGGTRKGESAGRGKPGQGREQKDIPTGHYPGARENVEAGTTDGKRMHQRLRTQEGGCTNRYKRGRVKKGAQERPNSRGSTEGGSKVPSRRKKLRQRLHNAKGEPRNPRSRQWSDEGPSAFNKKHLKAAKLWEAIN